MIKTKYVIFFLIIFLIALLPSFFSISNAYPSSLTVYHGKLIVAYPGLNSIYYYNGNLEPFLKIYDPLYISSNNYTLYIVSGNNLYYYNGSLSLVNISKPFMIFYDNYTNLTYVTTYNCYVYELDGTTVLNKTFIYESFGYMTFTRYAAIIDSQTGYIFLYYNGTTHTAINCQDALSGMIFAGKYFISGSFSPIGIFIFHNFSVLNLKLINDVYWYQLSNYNISFIYTSVIPDYLAYLNGVLYIASSQGLEAIDLNNYQVFCSTSIPVYSMIVYNNSVYVATPQGILRYDLQLPKIYSLRIEATNLIYKGQEWGFIINGTKYLLTNSSIDLLLDDGIYNISVLNSWIEKPNISNIILTLDSNYTINIGYTRPIFYVNVNIVGINGSVNLRINNETVKYNETNIKLKLPAGTYTISVQTNNYSVFPKDVIIDLYQNTSISFTAHSIQITSIVSKNRTSTNNIMNIFNIGVFALVAIIIIFIIISFKILKNR